MTKESKTAHDFLAGGGEMGALMRAKDWSETAVGPLAQWPETLRTAVRIMIDSRFAMWMGWGPELTFFYNDAYRPTLGVKHGWALGSSAREVWREIWPAIGPRIDTVLRTGQATWDQGLRLFLERSGYAEETYHTFSYSPLRDADGGIAGMLCVVTEETDRVIGERRLRLLREVGACIAEARNSAEVLKAVAQSLATNPYDLPFTLSYLIEEGASEAHLAASSGLSAGHPAAPATLPVSAAAIWPLGTAPDRLAPSLVEELGRRFELPIAPWDRPPHQALILPIAQHGQARPAGAFIVGLNPYRPLDAVYRGFLDLVVAQIASGLANARAYEEERRRAEALAEIDRAKTIFFSNASHEFRTPLALMLSPLEDLLVRHPMAEAVLTERRELELIHRNGLRLLKLVNTLLDFSRIEAGRVQALYEPVDLASYTAELASTFRSAMEKAGLRFTVDCPALPFPVHVDRDMWEKIVLNLVSNAFKYTLEGEVAVALRATGDGRVALTVRDTGVGIPPGELPHLFERFHRIEGQRGRTQEGTGIGLALVQELVRFHGGTVTAESRVGCGSVFTVAIPTGTAHLPADRVRPPGAGSGGRVAAEAFVEEALRWLPGAEAGEPSIVRELIGPARTVPAPSARARVLLADDNADMRDYVQRLLAQRYEVEAVADGEAALAAARRRRPDLVLSDVMMPRLDGFGLIKALRGDDELRDVPIVLLSARAGEEAKVEGLEASADDYLVKPFSARELLARVETNIAMARLRREAAEVLREETRRLRALNRAGTALTAELDLERLVQTVTDSAVELTGAEFGAFFYNVVGPAGEHYTLYTLSGAPREAFAKFPMPRNTAVFEPTFRGSGAVRSDDILADPRYGQNAPYRGMPPGHLPVRSYLAVPVVSRSGAVLGGLFFGHREVGVFGECAELIASGIAAHAAIAIDNARLYRASQEAQSELRALNATLEERVEARAREVSKTLTQLRESERNIRLIVESVVDYAIFMLDPRGMVSSWNPGAERIKGYRPDEIIGQHFSRFYTEEDRRGGLPERALRTAAETGKFEYEGWRVRKDGTRFWASVIIDAIRDDEGTLLGFAKVTRDLTEKRSIEEQLRHAQKMEAIGQLTGGVAHDFNNLLQVVLANLDSLRRRIPEIADAALGVDFGRFIEGALRGAERAATLTQQLLAFSRRQPLNPKPTDVNKLVAGMSDLLRRTLGETIAVETVNAGGLWRISVDANQLESALLNLAVNARDAMSRGGKLTIETANTYLDDTYARGHDEVAAGQYVMIAVSDTGAGMTRDVLEHVFEPFFTTKEVGHGTGLGLSQVYGFVKQSGGHVKIYSEPGEGTTVKLYLPRLRGAAEADESSGEAAIPRGRSSEVVLLVEDDEDVRAATGEMLRELGYGVIAAGDGASALRLVAARPEIRALVTDVGLPHGMNGRQLAEAVRARRPDLPVLFTTGYARNAIVHHGRLDPGIELLVKPFTYAALAAKLRDILS